MNSLPESLNGSISFGDELLANPENLFRVVRSQPDVWRALQDTTRLDAGEGRPRIPGEWALMFLAYLVGGEVALKRWHLRSPASLWKAAGFARRPNYATTYANFRQLEQVADAFREAAAMLIKRAVAGSDGKVGKDLHIDGTESETHSRLIHDCARGACPNNPDWKGPRKAKTAAAAKATSAEARAARHEEGEAPPVKAVEEVVEDISDTRGRRLKLGTGCWYRTADGDAGVRLYKARGGRKGKFWHGYYHFKVIDHYTGGVVAAFVTSASINEWKSYDEILQLVLDHLGKRPRAVVADKGFSVQSVFERNTRLGIATVAPYRAWGRGEKRKDHDRFDRHGVPNCKHCGNPTRFRKFSAKGQQPRLWVECIAGTLPECESAQTISCATNWAYLVPLWRTTEAYLALRDSHQNYERRHHEWCDKYLVAGDTHHSRTRRRGIGCQTLRSNAAQLIEWFGICWREGWLAKGKRQNTNRSIKRRAKDKLRRFQDYRHQLGLHLPEPLRSAHCAEIDAMRRRRRWKPAEPPPSTE